MKGASDTATKLCWNCQIKIPLASSQLVVFARFLHLFSILFHRLHQVSTAKEDLTFYASLFHFRKTRNEAWPFFRSLNVLTTWLIEQSKRNNQQESSQLQEDVVRSSLPPTTPPRVARDNPRHPFEEVRNYSKETGATPRKGVSRFPKHKTEEWQRDADRLNNCPGSVYYVKNQRGRCNICNKYSGMYCVLCKRFYCFTNRDATIKELIDTKHPSVSFMNGKRPPASLKMCTIAQDGTTKETVTVENSCYHM